MDSGQLMTPGFEVGNRSGRMWSDPQLKNEQHSGPMVNELSRRLTSNLSLN